MTTLRIAEVVAVRQQKHEHSDIEPGSSTIGPPVPKQRRCAVSRRHGSHT